MAEPGDIIDYASLVAALGEWSGGSSDADFPVAVDRAIGLAHAEISAAVRVPDGVARATLAFAARWEALPPGFRKMKRVTINGYPAADVSLRVVWPVASRGGWYARPSAYRLVGREITLVPWGWEEGYAFTDTDPAPVLEIEYYADPPRPSAAMTCTALLSTWPNLYLYGSLRHLQAFLGRVERLQVWEQLFQQGMAIAAAQTVSRGSVLG